MLTFSLRRSWRIGWAATLLWLGIGAVCADEAATAPPPWIPLESHGPHGPRDFGSPWTGLLQSPADPPRWPARPLRVLELVTGERLYVEWLRSDSALLDVRWRGLNRIRLPWEYVANISNLPGAADVYDESWESRMGAATARAHAGRLSLRGDRPWRYDCQSPLPVGRVQWRQHADGNLPQSDRVAVHLRFATQSAASDLVVSRDDAGFAVQTPPGWNTSFCQHIRSTVGWQQISCDWGDARWRVLVGDAVLAQGEGEGAFAGIQLGAGTESPSGRYDDFQVQSAAAQLSALSTPVVSGQIALQLTTGDVLYGDGVTLAPLGLRLHRDDEAVTIAWSDWAAVRRGQTVGAISAPRLVRGALAANWSSPPDWPRGLPPESWIAVVQTRGGSISEWDHPLLGTLAISTTDFVRTEHTHRGGFCWLYPGRVHLGDERRPDFRQPQSQGRMVSGSFEWNETPSGRCCVALDVAGMEPSGPATPPTEPYLQRLRGGALRTELYVNGRLVGDWNRLLNYRPPVSRPERLRMPIPPTFLQAGANRWEIRQQPLAANDNRCDDCELSRIALEVER